MEVADMIVEVAQADHKRKQLQQECDDIWAAGDVQVSGLMMSSSKDDDYDMAILVDQWFPITEESNASA